LIATLAQLVAWTPLLDPVKVQPYWPWLLIPLAAAIAVIYKTLKVRHVRQVPNASFWLTLTILGGMVLAGAALYLISIL
jgi:hypothetical protein